MTKEKLYYDKLKRKDLEIILEDLEFTWKKSDIELIKKMWESNCSLERMIKTIKRDGDEVFLLLLHLSRNKELKKRKNYIWGGIAQLRFYFIPKWARYIAQEQNGRWFAYQFRPNIRENKWIYEGKCEEVYVNLLSTLREVEQYVLCR